MIEFSLDDAISDTLDSWESCPDFVRKMEEAPDANAGRIILHEHAECIATLQRGLA